MNVLREEQKKTSQAVQTVVVLGPQRSGTSLVAGLLREVGVDMGRNLIGKTFSNPTGHYENAEFVELNDRILLAAGGDANHPPLPQEIERVKTAFIKDIRSLIQRSQKALWGWKDPRTALTLSLYLPFLENPFFILCRRDIESIAASLEKRSAVPFQEGVRLAQLYEKRIETALNSHEEYPRLEIAYEELLKNPAGVIQTLIAFLDIRPSPDAKEKARKKVLSGSDLERAKRKAGIVGLASTIPFFCWYYAKLRVRKMLKRL